MKKDLNRALNTFAAMDDLPESMLLEAERAVCLPPKSLRTALSAS